MTTTSIIPHEPAAIQLLFQNGGTAIDPLIKRIEIEVRSHVADLTTKKGRDAIASLAFKVSKSKIALDTAGKALTETQKAEIQVVDDARKKIRDRFDALRDEARKPLTDWEKAEADKEARQNSAIYDLRFHGLDGSEAPSVIWASAGFVKDIDIDGFEGAALDMANEAREHTLKGLRTMYAAAVQRDADAAELAALREASAARDEADRVAQFERDRVETARKEAEAAEAAERDRVEQERADEIARVAAAAQAAEWAKEAEAERVRVAEADKLAAVEAAKAEAQELHDKERKEAADWAKSQAVIAEQIVKDKADAQAAREADVAHRETVHAAITAALAAMAGNASPAQIATALMDGKIPHAKVTL
jgi:colicin import membrane protein